MAVRRWAGRVAVVIVQPERAKKAGRCRRDNEQQGAGWLPNAVSVGDPLRR